MSKVLPASARRRKSSTSGRVVQVGPGSPLDAMSAEHRGRLFALLRHGPTVCEELCGRRVHRATLLRWALAGSHGVKLRTVSVGRARHTSREWLLSFWTALSEVRDAQ